MRVAVLTLLSLLFLVAPALVEPGFSKKYERDYNILNPASRYTPDNSLIFIGLSIILCRI
ncbi:MAG: hypothetical protein HOP22_12260 [Nitrospiraceae bacterium]|jgi:hypothetical protein|nr:hypothetical protein [Nitrospiraceae bacterium]